MEGRVTELHLLFFKWVFKNQHFHSVTIKRWT